MVARNSKAESNSSAVVKLELSDLAAIEKVEGLKVSKQSEDSVTLEWKAAPAPQSSIDYEIVVQAPQYYPMFDPHRTTNTSITSKLFHFHLKK